MRSALRKTHASHLPLLSASRAKAFTLIELLVVIAIIAILAAIAFPVAGGMLDRGADAADLNNLRQIGTAMSQFVAERGRLPNAKYSCKTGAKAPSGSHPDASFMDDVERFLPPDASFSPSSKYNWVRRPLWFSKRFAKMPKGKTVPNNQYYYGLAWGMNSHIFYNSGFPNMNNFDGYVLKAPSLSKLVLVGEKNRPGGHDFIPSQKPTFERDVEAPYRVSRGSEGGEKNRAYYLFADYHIESLVGDQSSSTHPEYNSYSPENPLYYRW